MASGCGVAEIERGRSAVRTLVHLRVSKSSLSDPGLVEELRIRCPSGRMGGSFLLFRPEDDPEIQLALQILNQAGMRPWDKKNRRPEKDREFVMYLFREYSRVDAEECRLLEFTLQRQCPGTFRTEEGVLKLLHRAVQSRRRGMSQAAPNWFVVSGTLRDEMISAGLKGLKFLPTLVVNDFGKKEKTITYDWSELGEPLWELTSDVVLPPVAPSVQLVNATGGPVESDFSTGCYQREGLHAQPELRYRSRDLPGLDSFDLARTYEPFGTKPKDCDRRLVASRRFYEFCRQQKLRIDWRPVHIEGDE